MSGENVAATLIAEARAAASAFERDFAVTMKLDDAAMETLEKIVAWYGMRPIEVTAEMIALAERGEKI